MAASMAAAVMLLECAAVVMRVHSSDLETGDSHTAFTDAVTAKSNKIGHIFCDTLVVGEQQYIYSCLL
jgi:hypothetical protein